MQIKLGDFELIHSGVVITIDDNPITIKLPDEIEGDYTFIINFVTDNDNKDAVTKYTAIDKFTLQIDFKNFDGFMGGGNSSLITLGSLRNLPLYLNYRVFDLNNVGKTLMYNFYVGKEVENGN
ncbi:DUF6864 domain-containing function [Mangrovibacterium lignilyticum]|uniref:DUF6864 domain-containing function n=1 Tax=Mangrovibacterium lignilyticum TaxID=2668052 RepID=UPI0013D20B4F|nr:hypothetical protein [Mangrovibacterium lignilyticum]